MSSPVIVIMGAGQIGSAVYTILRGRTNVVRPKVTTLADTFQTYQADETFAGAEVHLWDSKARWGVTEIVDFNDLSVLELREKLQELKATHIINALPFSFVEKIAQAGVGSGCHYIDFTEDDVMAARVKQIYSIVPGFNVATKCGLAPGFINYVGVDLAKKIDKPEKLMICVGALPRNVSFGSPAGSYNLSWSVDGLVNEYIRPCQVRVNGFERKIVPLTGREIVMVDGIKYEAAFTSGGVGSLVEELNHIPNVYYKTLRYPGHYDYIEEAVKRLHGDFSLLKAEFLQTFPFNKDDVIIVYAECEGRMTDGILRRETFASHYIGHNRLSAIQSTTAGGGVAILELMLQGSLRGIITHTSVPLEMFKSTKTYQQTYLRRT